MWKVSWLYEKVHNIANIEGCAAILLYKFCVIKVWSDLISKIKDTYESTVEPRLSEQ